MSQPQGISGAFLRAPVRLPRMPIPLWLAAIAMAAAAALLPGLWSLAGLAAVVACVLMVLRPEIAIYLLTLSVPLGSSVIDEREANSFSVTPTEAIFALLVLGWGLRAMARRRLVVPFTPMTLPLLAVIGVVAMSGFHATNLALTLKETLKWLELIMVYFFIVAEMRTRRRALAIVLMLLTGATIEALLGTGQFVLGIGPEFFAIGRFMRAYGTFDQPNPYAGYLGMLIPLAVGLLLSRPSPKVRNYAIVALAAAATGVIVSLSRGAWVGIGIGFSLMMLFWSRRTRVLLSIGVIASAPLGALAFMNLLPPVITTRVAIAFDYFRFVDITQVQLTSDNWAVIERMAHWEAALGMIAAHPWFGVGAGNYPVVYKWYAVQGWPLSLGHAHNFYLNMAAETGIPGGFIYICFVLTALISTMVWLVRSGNLQKVATHTSLRLGHRAKSTNSVAAMDAGIDRSSVLFWRGILLGVLGALVASSLHNLFDNLFVHGMNVQLGMILALGQLAADALFGSRSRVSPTDKKALPNHGTIDEAEAS